MKKILLSKNEHQLLVRVMKLASNMFASRYIDAVDRLKERPYDEFLLDVARHAHCESDEVDSLWLKIREGAEETEGGGDERRSVWA